MPAEKVSPLNPPAAEKAQGSGRRAFGILGAVLAAVLTALGLYLFATRNQESTDDAQIEADVVPIAPRVGGAILRVDVADNQRVKAGQVLLEIDPADYEAKVKQAEADLALAQAQALGALAQEQIVEASAHGGFNAAQAALSGSSVGVGSADAAVDAAKAAVARSEADRRKAQIDLRRTRQLFEDHAVAQDRLDAADAAFDAADAARAQAKAQLASALDAKRAAVTRVAEAQGRLAVSKPIDAQIASAHAAAAAAQARVQASEAVLALAKLQLGYTKVEASVDGVASHVKLQPGEILSPGQPVLELVPEAIYVEANFKETQIGRMKPGQRAEITVDALPGRRLAGAVESLSGGTGARFSLLPPDNASGNFVKVVQRVPVRIRLTDMPKDVTLAAGLSADVTVYEE
ncbi:MAG: HlyD family secretion protein [Myxococcales bacterium]